MWLRESSISRLRRAHQRAARTVMCSSLAKQITSNSLWARRREMEWDVKGRESNGADPPLQNRIGHHWTVVT